MAGLVQCGAVPAQVTLSVSGESEQGPETEGIDSAVPGWPLQILQLVSAKSGHSSREPSKGHRPLPSTDIDMIQSDQKPHLWGRAKGDLCPW